jgi:zinc/manganese transport system permease protein
VRGWDFLFYASFGVVVTSSVRVGGVLLVFSYLIVPALAGLVIGGSVGRRLAVGWAFGALVSVAGMVASASLDTPTGATVVCVFGVALLALWPVHRLVSASRGQSRVLAAPVGSGVRDEVRR